MIGLSRYGVKRRLAVALLAVAPAVALACRDIFGPTEEPLTLRILFSGPAIAFQNPPPPVIDIQNQRFMIRYRIAEPGSGYITTAALRRRGFDSLSVEIRSKLSPGNGSLALVWKKDYEAESKALVPGQYRLSWWHVVYGTGSPRSHVLDTTIVIAPR